MTLVQTTGVVIDAIVTDERDNVATAIRDLEPGVARTSHGEWTLAVPLRTAGAPSVFASGAAGGRTSASGGTTA